MKQYIHYGASMLDKSRVSETRKGYILKSKPDKGLWASPVNAEWGWKDWCEAEDFRMDTFSESFRFRIDKKAKILRVRCEEDILPFVIFDTDETINRFRGMLGCKTEISDELDLERLYRMFDGIELFLSNDYSMHNGIFNSWDVDSIVVWNPNVILPIKP